MLRTHLAVACLLLSSTAAAETPVDRVLVLVDGRPVLWSEVHRIVVRKRPEGLPSTWHERRQLREVYRSALARRIRERRIAALAARQGIDVTEAEVDQAIAAIAEQNDTSVEALLDQVAQHGFTHGEYRAELRHQLRSYRLLAKWREQRGQRDVGPLSEQEERLWERELKQAVPIEWPR